MRVEGLPPQGGSGSVVGTPCPYSLRWDKGLGFRFQGVGFIGFWGFGFGVWDLGFGVRGVGLRIQGVGFRVNGSGFRVKGSGVRVWGSRFRV